MEKYQVVSSCEKVFMRLLLLCLLLLPLALFAQDSTYIREVKTYVAAVDALITEDKFYENGWRQRITEGTITFSTVEHSAIPDSMPVSQQSAVLHGGHSITRYDSPHGDSIYIVYHCNVPLNIYQCYYYRQQQLVCAVVKLQSATNWPDQYYFRGAYYREGELLQTTEQMTKAAIPYCYMIDFDAYADGMERLRALAETEAAHWKRTSSH